MEEMNLKKKAGTFSPNRKEAIHSWYSYLEGYSSHLIDKIIEEIGIENIRNVYDPFGGTGTTCLVASSYGIESYYSETNPFMRSVIEGKINCVKSLQDNREKIQCLKDFLIDIQNSIYGDKNLELFWGGFEKFFYDENLKKLLWLKDKVEKVIDKDCKDILMVLLSSIVVRSSKMIRQGDLRYAKGKEKKEQDNDIISNFIEKMQIAIKDVENEEVGVYNETTCLNPDCREIVEKDLVDCVITSPPYLNGTNYIRNTKLELKFNDFVETEEDLPKFHSKGIIAGINNVSRRNNNIEILDCVEEYIERLNPVAYDKRIPLMVAGYFKDMDLVIYKLSQVIKNDGYFIMDIGDSQFAGVHVPTHDILKVICSKYGFVLYNETILRKRRSRNGMVLTQRILKFRLEKKNEPISAFKKKAMSFIEDMPYKIPPYSGRNWGHPMHSLCSYHGKLKPAIAHFMIKYFSEEGDVVLDPLSGVGTIPFEACLQGRVGIGNDLSELAYIITKAKLEIPELSECKKVIKILESYLYEYKQSGSDVYIQNQYNDFGFNGKLPTYFHPETYREIIRIREYFISRYKELSSAEAMVYSCFLHVLHGNRPYALSRNSHPLTPYAPTGDFIYKNVIEHINNKLEITYKKCELDEYVYGKAINKDFYKLIDDELKVDAIICSPPFADSMKFYMQNWMRLWLCGWENDDFKFANQRFLDQRQKQDFDIYKSFFKMCSKVLKPNGKVILHLGKTKKIDMAEELGIRAKEFFYEVFRANENVENIEKHGIKDKGGTVEHQYLFLIKK